MTQSELVARWRALGYRRRMASETILSPPPNTFLRVYHMMEAKWALVAIKNQRLKVSRVEDLNDPFELFALNRHTQAARKASKKFAADFNTTHGLLCFGADWSNAVMWSHYGDKHKGICLGFDVRRTLLQKIEYKDKRVRVALGSDPATAILTPAVQNQLACIKAEAWKYEEELRRFTALASTVPVLLRCRNNRRPPSRAPGRSGDGAHRSSYGRTLGRSREGPRRRPKNCSFDDRLGVSGRTIEGRLPATYTATEPPRRAGIDSCRGADLRWRAVGCSAAAAPSAPSRFSIPTGAQCSGFAPLTIFRDRSSGTRSRRRIAGCASVAAGRVVSETLADLPLNCPRCGQRLRFSHVTSPDGRTIDIAAATGTDIHVYECWQHGRFELSRDIPLKPTG